MIDINNSNKILKDKSRMKVHHILSETLDVKQVDGMWRVFDTVKNQVVGDVGFSSPGEAEAARDRLRASNARTPRAVRNTPTSAPSSNTSISAGVRDGTPTSDSLTRGEKRRLARRGNITRRGVTYTRANIQAADVQARVTTPDLANDAARNTRTPATTPAPAPSKGLVGILKSGATSLGKFLSRRIPGMANTTINVIALEEALDVFRRAHDAEITKIAQADDPQAAGQAFEEMTSSGNIADWPVPMQRAYRGTIELTTRAVFEAMVTLITSGLSIAAAGALLGTIGLATGGLGLVLSIIGGAGLLILGTNGLSKILEELGVMDLAEAYITSQVISPEMMMGMAKVFDGTQADFGFDDHTPPQETFEESATTDNKAGLDNVMRMVKNNPELLAAYKKGKPAAIKALKSMKSTA